MRIVAVLSTLIFSLTTSLSSVFADDDSLDMRNAKWIMDGNLLVGGQHSASDITKMKQAGVAAIINLRMPAEFDNQALIEESKKQKISYNMLPIAGSSGITLENMRALDDILKSFEGEKVTLHCASGNRVGALLALRAFHIQGKSKEEALKLGTKAGMRSLKFHVAAMLK